MKFLDGVKIPTTQFVRAINGADYLPWATAVALAGRPQQRVVTFEGRPLLAFFGGGIVGIEQEGQQVFLPVLAPNGAPVPADRISPRDVGDALMRCRAKAVALVNGVGLSLYAGFGGDALGFLKALGVKPDSDLSAAPSLQRDKGGKGAEYVPWAAALAAARITDPDFRWAVEWSEATDWSTGEIRRLPVMSAAGGYMVAVTVIYKGAAHTEWLPVMGVAAVKTARGERKMDHQPLAQPTVFDWNKAVMRCLAKAIAVASGYGLDAYSGEDLEALEEARTRIPQRQAKPAEAETEAAPSETESANDEAASADLVSALEAALPADAAKRQRLLAATAARGWVPKAPESVAELVAMSREAAQRILDALIAKAAA